MSSSSERKRDRAAARLLLRWDKWRWLPGMRASVPGVGAVRLVEPVDDSLWLCATYDEEGTIPTLVPLEPGVPDLQDDATRALMAVLLGREATTAGDAVDAAYHSVMSSIQEA
jgi:hypothetical protein